MLVVRRSVSRLISRPDVKISEDASSDKSGTDPEDSSDNFSQADITDYQNYEQVGCQACLVYSWLCEAGPLAWLAIGYSKKYYLVMAENIFADSLIHSHIGSY